jgi:hypothetical protein
VGSLKDGKKGYKLDYNALFGEQIEKLKIRILGF